MGARTPRARIADLHPDDAAARLALRQQLVAARYAAGMSRRQFAEKVGRAKGTIQALEERTGSWTVATLQWWARGLGLRFTVALRGIPALPADPLAAVYAAMRPATAEGQDELARTALVNDMARARAAAGLTQRQLAARLGITEWAVVHCERDSSNLDVAVAQRHLRGLRGWAELRLTAPSEGDPVD